MTLILHFPAVRTLKKEISIVEVAQSGILLWQLKLIIQILVPRRGVLLYKYLHVSKWLQDSHRQRLGEF